MAKQDILSELEQLPSRIYIPTHQSAAIQHVLGLLIASSQGGLVLGGAGTGKSCILHSKLAQVQAITTSAITM